MLLKPCLEGGEVRVFQAVFQQPPDSGKVGQVFGLAIPNSQAREDADNFGVPTGAEDASCCAQSSFIF